MIRSEKKASKPNLNFSNVCRRNISSIKIRSVYAIKTDVSNNFRINCQDSFLIL
jgi:hypothetical protein